MWKMKNNIICSLSFIFHIVVNINIFFLFIPALLSLHHCLYLSSWQFVECPFHWNRVTSLHSLAVRHAVAVVRHAVAVVRSSVKYICKLTLHILPNNPFFPSLFIVRQNSFCLFYHQFFSLIGLNQCM